MASTTAPAAAAPAVPTFKGRNPLQHLARLLFFAILMALSYPALLLVALLRALWQRAVRGRASDILRSHQLPYTQNGVAGLGMIPDYYPAQLVLQHPLADERKLARVFDALVAESGLAAALAELRFEEAGAAPVGEALRGAGEANHYVSPSDAPRNWSQFMRSIFKKKALCIRVFNGSSSSSSGGSPTVLHCYLPGGAWDGTSCFNFVKELVHRYYDGAPNAVFKGRELVLSAAAKAKLDGSSPFCAFLARLPVMVWRNTTSMLWGISGVGALVGGPGMSFANAGIGEMEFTLLNFDEADSAALTAGLKALGKKPFAGFVHAAVTSYRRVLRENPYGVVMQASLQTRAYEPVLPARNLVGDWLIGPLQRVPHGVEYTLDAAQDKYGQLLAELEALSGGVARAAEARAYGVVTGGAAMCEVMPFYPDDQRVWSSVFFNNYGLRSMHPDAGVLSWNWGAPFQLGFNTICINGRTCICLASSLLGLPKLRAIRDQADAILRQYIAAGQAAAAEKPAGIGVSELAVAVAADTVASA